MRLSSNPIPKHSSYLVMNNGQKLPSPDILARRNVMNRRIYLWIGIVLALVVAAVITFAIFFYEARLTVIPTPGEADVLLNGQPITAGSPQKLPPGHYELTI